MKEAIFRYYGPAFDNPGLNLDIYNEEYFDKELEMESLLFFDLRKNNNIHPYRIVDSTEEEKKEIKKFFNENRTGFFFLIVNNNLIGSVLVLENNIQSLCINKEHQRQGYGEKLVKHAVNYIKRQNYEYVELRVMNGNTAAEKLYTKIGFNRIK